jgi:hypothetical protein
MNKNVRDGDDQPTGLISGLALEHEASSGTSLRMESTYHGSETMELYSLR